ncbi:MAG: choice-of-anchor L domain-containing protein, partial [Flavobacteriales bacterium]
MMRIAIITCVLTFIFQSATAQLVVDNSITLDDAMTLLLGPDVDYSNVTFTGAANQMGSFTSSGFDMGFPNGLILASGDCSMAPGPNNATGLSLGGGNFGASDPDLDQLDGFLHNDAAILEFDFVATGSSVSFRYVWASEEYPEFSGADENEDGFADCGDVSDVFGFFLSGPGIAGPFSNSANNIALIPGSTTFVSIHNLNGGCDGMAVVGDTDCNFCEYYVNNEGLDAQFLEYLQYDGLTVTLVASYDGLQCGETYHIKLAMADVSDT